MNLDLSSLEQASASLEKAVKRSQRDPADEELRDAVIQRFKYTYELCWKMLKRQLEREMPSPAEVDKPPYQELLREAAERGVRLNVERWMAYRTQRNITSHTYDSKKAKSVYASALRFLPDAKELLGELQQRSRNAR